MPGTLVNKIDFQNHFKNTSFFSESDIVRYLHDKHVHVNEGTLRWHIHQLKESNVLSRVKRGTYALAQKSTFIPSLSKRVVRIHKKTTGTFSPELLCLIWSTEWLHEFMVLQPTQHMIIFETERDWTESLFYTLKDEGHTAFLSPSRQIVEQYITGTTESFIVKPIISRAPTLSINNYTHVAPLEKILVDLICDTDLFAAYQGSELESIFTQVWRRYSLNLSVLINYAKRRKRLGDLLNFTGRLPDKEFHKMLST